MDHFDAETWSDYARGLTAEEQTARMRRHLEQGCPSCEVHVAAFAAIRRLVEHERELGLAPGVVRSVKAFFRQRWVRQAADRGAGRLQLVFDSRLAHGAEGTRGGEAGSRRLVYMSENVSLHLQVLPRETDTGLRVVGEVVDRVRGHLAAVPVAVTAGDQIVAKGETGARGEFDLPAGEPGALGLRFELGETLALELPG